MYFCKAINCKNAISEDADFCVSCSTSSVVSPQEGMSHKYPKYYKDVTTLSEIDVYAVHKLFNIQDPSGCIQHASKKLLLSGVRTGGKSNYQDISEAKDTLVRWLQLNTESPK